MPMNDSLISKAQVITYLLWAGVLGAVGLAWGLTLTGHQNSGHLLGNTANALSAVAAVAHVRIYVLTVCAQLRLMRSDLDRPEPTKMRGI